MIYCIFKVKSQFLLISWGASGWCHRAKVAKSSKGMGVEKKVYSHNFNFNSNVLNFSKKKLEELDPKRRIGS